MAWSKTGKRKEKEERERERERERKRERETKREREHHALQKGEHETLLNTDATQRNSFPLGGVREFRFSWSFGFLPTLHHRRL